MPARLVSVDDGKSYPLDKPIMLIGRHEDCDIQIESRKISRRHCCICELEGYLVVRDLGSTNGIFINNEKKEESRLGHGDALTIGNVPFRVEMKGDGSKKEREKRRANGSPAIEKASPPSAFKEPEPSSDLHIPLEAKSGEYS